MVMAPAPGQGSSWLPQNTQQETETLADFLRCLRRNREFSTIARRINYALTPTAIRNIEDGTTRRAKDTTLRILAEAYALDVAPEDRPAEVTRLYRYMLRLAGYDLLESGTDIVVGPQTLAEERLIERYRSLTAEARAAVDQLVELLERQGSPSD